MKVETKQTKQLQFNKSKTQNIGTIYSKGERDSFEMLLLLTCNLISYSKKIYNSTITIHVYNIDLNY